MLCARKSSESFKGSSKKLSASGRGAIGGGIESLECTELSGPFAASISARIQAWIAEVCFNLNNDVQSRTQQRTLLCVTPLKACTRHPGNRPVEMSRVPPPVLSKTKLRPCGI